MPEFHTIDPADLDDAVEALPDGALVRLVDVAGNYWGQFEIFTAWDGERDRVRVDDYGLTY